MSQWIAIEKCCGQLVDFDILGGGKTRLKCRVCDHSVIGPSRGPALVEIWNEGVRKLPDE